MIARIRVALFAVGFSVVSWSANATPITETFSFTGNITSSLISSAYNYLPNWWTGGVSGDWTVTFQGPGLTNVSNISESNNLWGGYDYNVANTSSSGCFAREVDFPGMSVSSRTFDGRGSDVIAECGVDIDQYDRLDLDLNSGTGFLQEYYSQPGYFQDFTAYFDITSVDGKAVTAKTSLVPEPGSLALFGFALVSLMGLRRWKRHPHFARQVTNFSGC